MVTLSRAVAESTPARLPEFRVAPADPAPASRRPAVTVCIPFEEIAYSKWVVPLFQLMLSLEPGDGFTTQQGAFIDTARNELVKQALATDGEYFFFIDSDTVPPEGALERLLAHRRDMVGGWYMVKSRAHPCVYTYAGQDPVTRYHNYHPLPHVPAPEDALSPGAPRCQCGKTHPPRLQPVDALGFGCMLIHRRVFEAIGKHVVRWFSTDEGGTEDLYFFRLAKQHGFTLYVDWSVHAAHLGVFAV